MYANMYAVIAVAKAMVGKQPTLYNKGTFVEWCFVTALGASNARTVLCQPATATNVGYADSVSYYKSKGKFHNGKPKQGHQMFFVERGIYCGTGIVYKVDRDYAYTIEEHPGTGEVIYSKYGLKNSRIGGYGVPKYENINGKTPHVYNSFNPQLQLPYDPSIEGWVYPLPKESVTSHPSYSQGAYGWRIHPIYNDWRFHGGVDISAPSNTEIYATRDGTVETNTYSSSAGNYIVINHGKYKSRYLHMVEKSPLVIGATVKAGAVIGKVGSTGDSTGPHLHFEIHKDGNTVDPAEYIYNEQPEVLFVKNAPTYNHFSPLYTSSSKIPSFEGNASSLFNRRAHILNDNESQLFQYGKFDRLFYGGISSCGHLSDNEIEESLNGSLPIRLNVPENNSIYWIKRGKTINGNTGINPYPIVKSNSTLPNNNAYCWGRACEILSHINRGTLQMCDNESQDWYDYALNTKHYECGQIPRVGSIICWSHNRLISNSKSLSYSYVGMVEQVLGNDSIMVSMMPHDCSGYSNSRNAFEYKMLINTNSNWGLNSNEYEFRGFIYLFDISLINKYISVGDTIKLKSSSSNYNYNSLSIGLRDIKHFNKMKIVYDLTLNAPKDVSISQINMKDSCKLYLHMSQRVNNYAGDIVEDCTTSYLPHLKDEYDSNGNQIKKTAFDGPFPFGAIFLRNSIPESLFDGNNYNESSNSYELKNVTEIFSLSRANVRGTYTDVFEESTWQGYDGNKNVLIRFNRQLQTYLGATLVTTAYDSFAYTIELNIKQIILYR